MSNLSSGFERFVLELSLAFVGAFVGITIRTEMYNHQKIDECKQSLTFVDVIVYLYEAVPS
jgi:hypothetical protein